MDLTSVESATWFIVFGVFVASIQLVLRRLAEIQWPVLVAPLPSSNQPYTKAQGLWKVINQAFPLLLGGVLAFLLTSFPFPPGWDQGSARVLMGVFAGSFAGQVWTIVRRILAMKTGVKLAHDADKDGPSSS